jgi:putative flippase GtrA
MFRPRETTTWKRWWIFNFVGFVGVGIQLLTLALLHGCFGLHYLPSTALAVESAVIHNFAWHERWTWADRSSRSLRHRIFRLIRFNLSNGGISVVGNLVLMKLLVGELEFPYLPANLLAIVVCSIANFLTSDLYVFRVADMGIRGLRSSDPEGIRENRFCESSDGTLDPLRRAAHPPDARQCSPLALDQGKQDGHGDTKASEETLASPGPAGKGFETHD